jgi:hypothetical protein
MTSPPRAAALALCLAVQACGVPDAGLSGTSATAAGAGSGYAALEARFASEGRLREDPAPADAPWGAAELERNFARIALSSEYRLGGGGMRADGAPGLLRRWTEPVRLELRFGPSVPEAQRTRDRAAVAGYAEQLAQVTGHPVGLPASDPNVLILVMAAAELRALGPVLARDAPDMSAGARRAITRMPPDILCLAVARPHADPRRGHRGAIVVVRAEHPPRLRRSCIQEELAQVMGLPDDSSTARPSIFNDDEEFGVLTRHDEALLRMLYDPRLRPGMTPAELAPLLPAIAADAAARD